MIAATVDARLVRYYARDPAEIILRFVGGVQWGRNPTSRHTHTTAKAVMGPKQRLYYIEAYIKAHTTGDTLKAACRC